MLLPSFLILYGAFLLFDTGYAWRNNIRVNLDQQPATLLLHKRRLPLSDYVLFENSLYKYHKGPSIWYEARAICEREGGHLAIINSDNEAHFLRGMMEKYQERNPKEGIDPIYLGAHDLFKEGQFVTVDDKPLEGAGWVRWKENQPDNAKNKEHCVIFLNSGGLNDIPCTSRKPFICEIGLNNLPRGEQNRIRVSNSQPELQHSHQCGHYPFQTACSHMPLPLNYYPVHYLNRHSIMRNPLISEEYYDDLIYPYQPYGLNHLGYIGNQQLVDISNF